MYAANLSLASLKDILPLPPRPQIWEQLEQSPRIVAALSYRPRLRIPLVVCTPQHGQRVMFYLKAVAEIKVKIMWLSVDYTTTETRMF